MIVRLCLPVFALFCPPLLRAWDYEGHRLVNQLALAALPPEFPRFVHTLAQEERIAFLASEFDRWRNVPDLPLKHGGGSWTDHFLDLEHVVDAGIDLTTLTPFRYEFVVQFAAGRAAHAEMFPPIDPARNADRTATLPGFAPWAITEGFGRLRSAFSYLKVFEELGSPDDIANAEANIVYLMGTMGHYVGDCSQPLHTTKHHNGWVGPNPRGYTTWSGLHAWIDGKEGGIFAKARFELSPMLPRVEPATVISLATRPDGRDPMFVAVFAYLQRQHAFVEPLYQLERDGKFGNNQPMVAPEGRAFIEARLLEGGQMLAALWVTAWRGAVPDPFLRAQLLRRQAATEAARATSAARVAP